ncbi:ERBB-3 BINDING PROTEIN 1 [Morus notabilis]|uniref:ERBB-3 BINDING PROTEIN 1 n=1 Tax=Morus notabilis TaxID=981085 RepID=UPI000CED770C|nr:ERBB-3 BINDING PROTEIN 1 [Morus notabilis]
MSFDKYILSSDAASQNQTVFVLQHILVVSEKLHVEIWFDGNFAENKDVTEAIEKVAAAYDCKIVEGVLSHQLKQFVIDGNKVVLSVSNPDTRVDDADFEENEVDAIDIVTSTGDGKPKLLDEKQTTIYKRAVDKNNHLKMKASRFIFSEIDQKFPIMPFTARSVDNVSRLSNINPPSDHLGLFVPKREDSPPPPPSASVC